MTTELDDDLVPEVLTIIEDFGIDAVFQVDAGSFNDVNSTWTPSTSNVTRKVTPPGPRKMRRDGVANEQTIAYLAASGLTFTPKIDQLVTIDSRTFRVTAVTAIYSGTLVCMYELVLD